MSQTQAVMFSASTQEHSHRRLAQIARWRVAQRLPELDIFEALLDLRAMAMKILDLDGAHLALGSRTAVGNRVAVGLDLA